EFVKIDNQAPVLADQTIKLRSQNYAVTDYYVVPGDYAELEIEFTDAAYDYSEYGDTAKPTVIIKDLASFIEVKKYDAQGEPVLDIDDNFIYEAPENHSTLGGWLVPARYISRSGNQWTVEITGDDLRAKSKTADPLNSEIITVDVYDVVGNTVTTATRFIEIAEETIVPIIVDNDKINFTTPTESLGDVEDVFAPLNTYLTSGTRHSTVTVEIDVAQDYYVDGIELTVPGYESHFDITYQGLTPIIEAGVPVSNKRLATFHVSSSDDYSVTASSVDFQVRVWRSPYGMPVYEQTRTFNVQIDNPVFSGGTITSVSNVDPAITNYIKPGSQFEATMTFPRANIVGKSGKDLAAAAQSYVKGLFKLSSSEAMTGNISVTQDITHSATMTLKWRANAKSPIADVVATFNATVKNVYGIMIRTSDNPVTKTNVYVDKNAPVIADNGIIIKVGTDETEYSYNATEAISVYEDWNEITVTLNDPVITGTTPGTGITGARLRLVPTGTTYTGTNQMAALNAPVTFTNASGATTATLSFDLSDLNISAYDLSVGMYNIIIDQITDRIGNTGLTYTQAFYFNPAETSITLSEFADGTHIVNLSEATVTDDSRHLLEALVNDPSGTVNGVRFQLYYDWQNKYADEDNHFNPEENNPEFDLDDYDTYINHLSYGSVTATEELYDEVPPYQANWNLNTGSNSGTAHRDIYNWVPQVGTDPFYPRTGSGATLATDPVRYFLVRITAITQSRYIYEDYVRVGVKDDVAPIPNDPIFPEEVTFSATPAQNTLNISTDFTNWPDVKSVEYQIKTLDGINQGDPIVVLNPALTATSPSSYANTNTTNYTGTWNFDEFGTGYYTFTVTTTDYSGNSATFEYEDAEIWIKNPAFETSYTLTLSNVNPTNDDVEVSPDYAYNVDSDTPSNVTYFGADYAEEIGEIRANVTFAQGLSGISKFRLVKNTYNKVTGRWIGSDVAVTSLNDSYYHGDDNDYVIDDEGYVIVIDENGFNQFHNITAPIDLYLFIPEANYATAEDEDYIHEYYVELVPLYEFYSEEELEEFKENNYDYKGFGIDRRAPQILNVSVDYPVPGLNKMSWAMPATFRAYPDRTYDFNDVVNNSTIPVVEWKLPIWSDDEWKTAEITGQRIFGEDIDNHFRYTEWNVAGGSIAAFLGSDFEGIVNLRLYAVDALGNEHYQPFNVYVDNNAPDTKFTHVMHGINYPELENIANQDSIYIQYSDTGNGKADLKLFVDASTLSSDAVMPLMVYQQKPGTNNWMPALYDHEAWNLGVAGNPDLYEFTIPTTHQEAGNHRFIVVAKDILGNLEGDLAGNLAEYIVIDENAIGYDEDFDYVSALAKYFAYDENLGTSWLDPESGSTFKPELNAYEIAPGYYLPRFNEKQIAVDLMVHIEHVNDVVAQVVAPTENDIVRGYQIFTADTFDPTGYTDPVTGLYTEALYSDRDKVTYMSLQRNSNGNWVEFNRVEKADSILVHFELLRNNVPEFDGLPWVPGVHLYNGNDQLVELEWNNSALKWEGSVKLATNNELNPTLEYDLTYRFDLNNDGIISDLDNAYAPLLSIRDIPEFTLTPWSVSYHTAIFAQGIHEFRAVPLNADEEELEYMQTPTKHIFIDNVAPVINTFAAQPGGFIYNDETTSPYGYAGQVVKAGQEVPFNFDVTGLLVDADDYDELNVTFQWSGQPVHVGPEDVYYRKWNTTEFNNNVWTAQNPLTDLIDNNLVNGIDDPAEANSPYYIRFIANDAAGNITVSNEYKLLVDASPAYMQITTVNELEINYEDDNEINIFNLPTAGTDVVITAIDITEDFDPAHTATINYQYKENYNDPWGNLETSVPMPVVDDQVLFTLPAEAVLEGYFRFRAVGADIHNNEGAGNWVTVLFNNTNAYAEMTFLSFNNGNRQVLPYENTDGTIDYYLFSNGPTAINGEVMLNLRNYEGIESVSLEYSTALNENGEMVNPVIATQPVEVPAFNSGSPEVTIAINDFVAPVLRATQFYIRAKATDGQGNYSYSDKITVYNNVSATDVALIWEDFDGFIVELDNFNIDEENPNEKVYAFDLNAYEDDEEITFTVAYENQPVAPFNLVNQLILTVNDNVIYNTMPEDEDAIDPFNNIYPKEVTFNFTKAEFIEALGQDAADDTENTYELKLIVKDHAGNDNTQEVEAIEEVLFDNWAPRLVVEHFILNEDNEHEETNAVLYNDTVYFTVEYTDEIGLFAQDALEATFSHIFSSTYNVTDTVTEYELVTEDDKDYLVFAWTPSEAMQQRVLNGHDALEVAVNISVTDCLDNTREIAQDAITLYSGHHSFVRLMVVTDQLADATDRRINYVNWNASTAEVLEEVGTNRTVDNPAPVKLYAYAPHNAELPTSVRFEYRRTGFVDAPFVEIAETNVVNS
ncbi:MAG: hypothetical protein WC234_04560, partial [Endomicrobiaceae bacterium]